MSLVSIIVPVYNVSPFIEKCVSSLLSQTYTNLEILLVDDGSPDDCPMICDVFARRDDRVKVIHQKNAGLSAARNAGIRAATGEYLAFVDGDDFVASDFIEVLLNACQEHHAQMAACGFWEYYSEEKKTVVCVDETMVLSSQEAIIDIFTMKSRVQVMAWNKLYARELVKDTDIRYPEGCIHEDVFTTYRYCAVAEKVVCVPTPGYYYVQRPGSIISQKFSPKRLQLLDAVKSIRSFVEEKAPVYNEAYCYYLFMNYLTIINAMADNKYYDRRLFCEMRRHIQNDWPKLKNNAYMGKKNKLTYFLLFFGMRGYYVFRKLYTEYR